MPAITVYCVGSWKSTHEYVVPMFTALDCDSKAPADPPLTAYRAVIAFPGVVPSMYAMISVTDPEVVHVKYETD